MFVDFGPYFVYFAAFSVNLISFSVGCAFAWTSPVLPKFHDIHESPLQEPTTVLEDSWITSLLSLGAIFGPFLASYVSEIFGRKVTMLTFSIPMLVSHGICAFATKVYLFFLARFLLGIGIGGVFCTLPSYIGEISALNNRGMLLCIMSLMISLGNLFVYAVGPFISIQILSILNMVPLVVFMIFFGLLVPESAFYYIQKNDHEKAEKALLRLRGKNYDIQREIALILKTIEDGGAATGGVRDIFKSRSILKALIISTSVMVFQQFSGINAVLGNMETIFKATKSSYPPQYSVIIVGCIQLVTTVITAQIVEKVGRKALLIQSFLGTSVSLGGLAIYFYLKAEKYDLEKIFWFPLACFLIYIVTFNSGLACIPWALTGELFPSHVKSLASALTACCNLTFSFIITMCFPHISEILGLDRAFGLFSTLCGIGFVFTILFVPETKGKSLAAIQLMLQGKNTDAKL